MAVDNNNPYLNKTNPNKTKNGYMILGRAVNHLKARFVKFHILCYIMIQKKLCLQVSFKILTLNSTSLRLLWCLLVDRHCQAPSVGDVTITENYNYAPLHW